MARIAFVKNPNEACSHIPGKPDFVYGCYDAKADLIIMPLPGEYDHEEFAQLLAHELGHVKGWRH